jgi:hypothetical protein
LKRSPGQRSQKNFGGAEIAEGKVDQGKAAQQHWALTIELHRLGQVVQSHIEEAQIVIEIAFAPMRLLFFLEKQQVNRLRQHRQLPDRLGPDDDEVEVTAIQVREVVTRLAGATV